MNESHYLDENDLPFTEDEVSRALALTGDEHEARDAAHTLAEMFASDAENWGWSLADEVFASLALLSDSLRGRVDAYMRVRWDGLRRALVHDALRREGLPPGAEPTASGLQAADEEIARHVEDWRQGCAALAEWVRRRQAGEPVEDEPPPWPGHADE